ncbi:MAG TPA: hypothetical protein VIV06_04720, partial [Candidatus Limnocylindrales bacterium]
MSTRSTDGAPGPLRILVVAPFLPYPPEVGTATRIFQLARHLSRRHEVTLIAYGRASDAAAVDSLAGHGIRAHAVVPPPRIRAPGTPPLAGIERLHTRARMVASLPLPGSYQGRYLVTNELRSALARLF